MTTTIFLLLWATSAAQTPDAHTPLLEEAKSAVANLEYDQAAALLREVIVTDGLSENDLIEARLLLGSVEVIRGSLSEARLHYRWALERRPDLELPAEEAPKVRGYFTVVKEELERERAEAAAAAAAVSEAAPTPAPAPAAPVADEESVGVLPWALAGAGVAAVAAIVVVGGATAVAGGLYYLSTPSLGTVDFREGGS